MKLLLTSRSVLNTKENGVTIDSNLNPDNGFIEIIKNNLENFNKLVFICNESFDYSMNDNSAKMLKKAFEKVGINFKTLEVLDERNAKNIDKVLENASVIYLQGGKIEIQAKFLEKYNAKKYLKNSNALIIGQSAGSMNLAGKVYNYPETDEEKNLPKFYTGLGLTNINIIPHFNLETGNVLFTGSFNLLEDYFLKDSFLLHLLAFNDGSFIFIKENENIMCGEAYKIENGKIEKICENNKTINLNKFLKL